MSGRRTRSARAAGLGNIAWGSFLLLTGDLLWQDLTGRAPGPSERGVVRVLGTRHLVQGLGQVAAPGALPRLWRFVDLSHAGSMLPVAVLDVGRRRPAALSAAASLGSALVAARAARYAGQRARARRLLQAPTSAPRRARR